MNELRFQKTFELRKQLVWVRGIGPSNFQQCEFHNCKDLKGKETQPDTLLVTEHYNERGTDLP